MPWSAGRYPGSKRRASSYRESAASWVPAAVSASAFIVRLWAVSGFRTTGRGMGLGGSGFGTGAWTTGGGGGGGGAEAGGAGGAAAKLKAIVSGPGSGLGSGPALGTGVVPSYTLSPSSSSAAMKWLPFVRSRMGRSATHQPTCAAAYRKRRKGMVEKRVRSEEHTSELQSQFHLVC